MVNSVDRVAFYQLKTMMQGVVARGTARAISNLSPYVAGKTGTTDDENDTWFMGFTNDVTVAIWVGYDNAEGKRRTLLPDEARAWAGAPWGGSGVPALRALGPGAIRRCGVRWRRGSRLVQAHPGGYVPYEIGINARHLGSKSRE